MADQYQQDQAALAELAAQEKLKQFQETRAVLDTLRAARKARGGVGAPLGVPAHLKGASTGRGIVITDADLREDTPLPASLLRNNLDVKEDD